MKKYFLLSICLLLAVSVLSQNLNIYNVPSNIRKPGVYIDYNLTLANQGLVQNPQVVLLIGMKSDDGVGTIGTLYEIFDSYAGSSVFGSTSNIASMINSAIVANPYVSIFAMAFDSSTSAYAISTTMVVSTTRFQTVLDNVFPSRFNFIVPAVNSTDFLLVLKTHIETAGNAIEQRGQVAVFAFTTSASFNSTNTMTLATTAAAALNSGRMLSVCYPNPAAHHYNVAAAVASVLASTSDPALPFNGVQLTGITPAPVVSRLSRTQQESLMTKGCTPIEVGQGSASQIVRTITTFMTQSGAPSIALLDVNVILILDYTRLAIRTRLLQQFPRQKFTDRAISQIRSAIISVLKNEEQLEILQDINANIPGLILERNIQDNTRLDIAIPSPIVPGLYIIAAELRLIL